MARTSDWQPRSPDAWDWCISGALLVGTMALLLATDQMGIPRDESFYFRAGGDYAGWFEQLWTHWERGELWKSFTKSNIDRHWSYNTEHPVLMKTLFGLSHLLFYEGLGWLDNVTAFRVPGMLTGAGTVVVTYLFGRQIFGRFAGLVASAALLFQPRFFYHAHLACFDVPITFFWVATVYAYWRSYGSRGWAVASGILWGLALLTKLNAFFLPIVVFGHWVATHWSDIRVEWRQGNWRVRLPEVPEAFLWIAVLGPLLFYALTPRYWFDTFERVGGYISFHLQHINYFVRYFGENVRFTPLPVSYPWVMTLVTVPATLLVAACFGGVRAALAWDPGAWLRRWGSALRRGKLPSESRPDPRGTSLLLILNLLFPIALISLPSTPIFGGTKHWMNAMPFLAIFAGAGAALAAEFVRDAAPPSYASVAHASGALLVAGAVAAPAALATKRIHPFGTSYYNELIGGIRGAADRRMFRQFWGYASRQALPWLNEHAPEHSPVWLHNTTGRAWWFYEDRGWAREDLRASSLRRSDFALYHQQKAFVFKLSDVWRRYETRTPAHVVSVEGVPLLSVYRRPSLLDEE